MVQGYNLFAYCFNNPVSMSDRSGCWPQCITDAVSTIIDAAKKVASPVANKVKSSILSALKSNILAASLPKTGEANSSQTLPNPDGTPKQKRWYGPDGNAVRDRDYNHPGDMPFPHDHEWNNGIRGEDHLPPSPAYEFSWEPVVGIGIVTICVVGMIIVAVDDTTVLGVADDFLFGPLGAGLEGGLIMIFG